MTERKAIVVGDNGKRQELQPGDTLFGASLPPVVCFISLQNCCQAVIAAVDGLIPVCLRNGTVVSTSPKVHNA